MTGLGRDGIKLMRRLDPGRFTCTPVCTDAGQVEVTISNDGIWQLKARLLGELGWHLVCSGDLDGRAFVPPAAGEAPIRLGPLRLDGAPRADQLAALPGEQISPDRHPRHDRVMRPSRQADLSGSNCAGRRVGARDRFRVARQKVIARAPSRLPTSFRREPGTGRERDAKRHRRDLSSAGLARSAGENLTCCRLILKRCLRRESQTRFTPTSLQWMRR